MYFKKCKYAVRYACMCLEFKTLQIGELTYSTNAQAQSHIRSPVPPLSILKLLFHMYAQYPWQTCEAFSGCALIKFLQASLLALRHILHMRLLLLLGEVLVVLTAHSLIVCMKYSMWCEILQHLISKYRTRIHSTRSTIERLFLKFM